MEYNVSKKRLMKILIFGIFTIPLVAFSQYTDVINSNRPGLSVSAYAIGTNVLQAEFGIGYEQQDHTRLATESNILGADLSLRYGLLFETLELNYEGTFDNQNKTYTNTGVEIKNTDFSRNRIGLKFLVYDPFKNPENNKPNLYSWKANYGFKLKN
ncbi:MAG TPA: transporter, partial [Arenibacter sp.]|nr:transporter [Arenibacter sp.]